ncbi:MAG: MarR family winged helix-turn-helix transcriptional regulator [Aureispira sp.]
MQLESKILNGLERLSEVLKALLWEKAKIHGISPIQIQILLFVSNHSVDLCNVSYLAKEFSITKATVSDAVKVLLKKQFLEKDFSPTDKRRYNLLITKEGEVLVGDLAAYSLPLFDAFAEFSQEEKIHLFETLSKLIFQLHQKGIIEVQRTCYNCQNYQGNKIDQHFCILLDQPLQNVNLRLDCPEFEEKTIQEI